MKPFILLAKYYGISLLLGSIVWFYKFSFGFYAAPQIMALLCVFILWGLMYSHLKDSSGEYTSKDFAVIYVGVTVPALLMIWHSPDLFSLKVVTGVALAGVLVFINFVLVKGLLSISKGMVKSIPDSDYDS